MEALIVDGSNDDDDDMWHCTCFPPPVYDLTDACCGRENDDDSKPSNNSTLREALCHWGWCKVVVDRRKLPVHSPLRCLDSTALKEQIRELFEPKTIKSLSSSSHRQQPIAVYRGRSAESGAATSKGAEPKQSWEIERCCRRGRNQDRHELHDWAEALHSIVRAVTVDLGLPPNLLLKNDPCPALHHARRCNVDLMRVFYYDSVDETDTLGSSPHTDWGSWTCVWQDTVGGLQTYCQHHERWVDVVSTITADSMLCFVVHLSDVTSLAMGNALLSTTWRSGASSQQSSTNVPVVRWPSPKHRVVSPTAGVPRASLVYFAYPPPGVTLSDMEEGITSCVGSTVPGEEEHSIAVPYDQYFVLRNQSCRSSLDDQELSSAKQVYEQMKCRPLDAVFDEKWKQVQRS